MIRRPSQILLPAFTLAALSLAAACLDPSPCFRKPTGSVEVYVRGGNGGAAWEGTGTITTSGPDDSGAVLWTVTDSLEARTTVVFRAPAAPPVFDPGVLYRVRVSTVPGMPTPSGVQILHGDTLVFAALSDYRSGDRVFPEGIPGFSFGLTEAGCGDRGEEPCFSREENRLLRLEHAGESVELFHGDSAAIGSYRVTCLTARHLEYSRDCADAGSFEISFLLARN